MSATNLADDIFDYIPVREWSEEQKISFGLKFVELFFVYLSKSLDVQLHDDNGSELANLLAQKAGEKEIVAFYNRLFPELGSQIAERAVEFRKMYLFNLYLDKLNKLEENVAEFKANNKSTIELETALKNWQKILTTAKEGDWAGVKDLISIL
jgi:hypothetical protein